MKEIICAGFGGQGVLITGMILAYCSMRKGEHFTWYPSYGSEMRGGTANCNVKISEEEIASPYAKHLDILLSMNDVAIGKFEPRMKPGATLFANSSLLSEDRVFRPDINVVKVPASQIAAELHNPRGTNIVMLGALCQTTGLYEKEFMKESIDEYFAKKGKVNPGNSLCFDAGVQAVLEA
ncbi:MAG: 2-oxoacid:acceptor oxidoreductase family protein [Eubacteriales bacterium]|nr:2-oxoacid:acceptor oxidoreductase family protein [Eubacteriales bacterium]